VRCKRFEVLSILPENSLKKSKGNSMAKPDPRKKTQVSLNQKAYTEIRRRILNGELSAESPLSEYQLADELQLSRTPVREAVKRLEREGLVQSLPNRGTFVAELTVKDISEIYQVREQLEGFAAHVAADTMSDEAVERLEKEISVMNRLASEGRLLEIVDSDIRIHQQIIASTQNSRLIALLGTLDDQMYRVRALFPQSPQWFKATLVEHTKIVKAIKAHDGAGAESAMKAHLRSAREYAIRQSLPMDFR
jgi:DNA-binding GntR family transcriptional regulator